MAADRGIVSHFVSQFHTACNDGRGDLMHSCFSLDEESFVMLQMSLKSESIMHVCEKVSLFPHNNSQAKRFKTLLQDYLLYVQQYPWPVNVYQSTGAYDAWVKVYSAMIACFTLPDTVWLVRALKYVAMQLVLLAIRIDNEDTQKTFSKTIDAAGRLSKGAGLAANDRSPSPGAQTKRAAVLKLANLSFRAYFQLKNTRLCETVLGSVHNALLMNRRNDESTMSGEELYPVSERVTYHFYVGQIRLFQHRIQAASQHLRWAFDNCTNAHAHNKRKILISLIAAHLILGRYPKLPLLHDYDLVQQYAELARQHRLGHAARVMAELERNRDWLRARGLYMILREKLALGLWRNLFQRCMRLIPDTNGTSNAPPTLPLRKLVRPARLAWNDNTLSLEDLECMAANLVDQVSGLQSEEKPFNAEPGPYEGIHPPFKRNDCAAARSSSRFSARERCVPRLAMFSLQGCSTFDTRTFVVVLV